MICPLYETGSQKDPANDRPVCLISHIKKIDNTAVLSILNEQFTTARSKFGLEHGSAVTEALLQVQENAGQGRHHAAVLDLEKAYDKVEKRELLKLFRERADERTV